MASPFQQAAQQRKLIYIFVIVVLFTGALLFRNGVVDPQAEHLALREQNVGEVQLNGEAIRLSLTGLRGVASCVLWIEAMDRQKKNQWDELRLLVESITKLQPHFITPWLFQSWNLSYNVAVQCDLPRDKYYYIAEGVQLLAEGERQNRDQPELRFAMGTYYHQKISMHDHKVPLQTLFEMSLMDPLHRDPAWLQEKDGNGRPRYEKYLCLDHARLVRRLREKLGCVTLKQVFEYLKDNQKIPSVYGAKVTGEGEKQETARRLVKDKPFPILPPLPVRAGDLIGERRPMYKPEALPSLDELGPDLDALAVARTWYAYAQEPLPAPDPVVPGNSEPIQDRIRQRLPVHMTTIIFRDYPGLAQSLLSDRIAEEGWFDATGWNVPPRFFGEQGGDRWANGDRAVLGTDRDWGVENWRQALSLWREFGNANHLLMTTEQEADWDRRAAPFLKKYNIAKGANAPPLRGRDRDDPVLKDGRLATDVLASYALYRRLTNFAYHYSRAEVESRPNSVAVRKALYEAEQLRLAGGTQALPKYEAALTGLAQILADNPDFRASQAIGEDCFELQWNYIQLFNGRTATAPLLKQQLLAQAVLGQGALAGPDLSCLALMRLARPQGVAAPVLVGPLDRLVDGQPIIDPSGVRSVLQRKRLIPEQRPAGPATGPPAAAGGRQPSIVPAPGRPAAGTAPPPAGGK
jgi:hypothetical protein